MRTTLKALSAALLVVLALAGLPHVAAQDEPRVYLPAVAKPPQRIVFGALKDQVVRLVIGALDGSGPIELNSGQPFSDYAPAWSPRGDRIAFLSTREITAQIYLMRPDGSGQTRLIDIPGGVSELKWSPDGSKIALLGVWSYRLYVINADGSSLRELSTDQVVAFDWAPDGTRLVYSTLPDLATWRSQLWQVQIDRAEPVKTFLYHASAPVWDLVRWSPDGTRIAFGLEVGSGAGVVIINADGTGPRTVTETTGEPEWSPDGSRLAVCTRDTLYLFDRDGGNQQVLYVVPPPMQSASANPLLHPDTFTGWHSLKGPSWSPDGRWLSVHDISPYGTAALMLFRVDSATPDGSHTMLYPELNAGAISWSR